MHSVQFYQVVEPDNPGGRTLLSVASHSGSSVYSKQTTVSAAGNINAALPEQQWSFSWEKFMLLSCKTCEVSVSTWEIEYAV